MVWLIILAVLALAVGPIFYLLPSAQDRFLAGLRQHARQLGFSMQLQRLGKLNPTAEERVSASGQQRDPVVECMRYQWLVRATAMTSIPCVPISNLKWVRNG